MYPTMQRTVPGSVGAIPDVDGRIGRGNELEVQPQNTGARSTVWMCGAKRRCDSK
jgi:hypothetical protein